MSWLHRRGTRARRDDGGFTLIELLVVIIIIGILAAVAIPVYLSQRHKAQDAATKSDLRAVAQLMETYLVDNQTYPTTNSQVTAAGLDPKVSKGILVAITNVDGANGYCLGATNSSGSPAPTPSYFATIIYWFDSRAGGLQPAGSPGCPTFLNFGQYPGIMASWSG